MRVMYGVYVCVTHVGPAGPEYLRKRMLQDGVEDNVDTDMHEPLLAEEEPLPTPPESPSLNELDRLMPDSTPAHTPSPSPGITNKEDPQLLRPGSWSGEKSSKGGGSAASSRANSRTTSRPTTPSSSSMLAPVPTSTPEGTEVAAPSGPSRQSSGVEPGSDLEIKPLQKFDGEESTAAPVDPVAPTSIVNGLISQDEDQTAQPVVKAPPKAAHKPEPAEMPGEPTPLSAPPSRAASVPRISVEPSSRTPSRPGSRSETKPVERREPSPGPSATPKLQAKFVAKSVEAKAVIGQPAVTPLPTVEAKVEAKPKTVMKVPSKERTVDSVELEVIILSSHLMYNLFENGLSPLAFC